MSLATVGVRALIQQNNLLVVWPYIVLNCEHCILLKQIYPTIRVHIEPPLFCSLSHTRVQLGTDFVIFVRHDAQSDSPRCANAFLVHQMHLLLRHSTCKNACILKRCLHANGQLSYGDKAMLLS